MGGRSGIERCRAAPRDLALSEEQLRALHARAGVEMLKVRPSPRWNCMDSGVTWAVFERTDLLRVIVSVDPFGQGERCKLWRHASLSRIDRMPSYQDIADVKEDFVGPANRAVMIFPPRAEHVNDHQFCLHLYHAVGNEDGLPDFRVVNPGTGSKTI